VAGTNSDARSNRLIEETSPYLLQHAHNPVDWYPWGEEALGRAKVEQRMILLSIGYAACHWCHVMERESFEDETTATLMNEHFVNIKVDREERPDLDEIYMAATVAMNQGQGGWPMTVFLTPELEPVFTGTYFPPDDGYGRPSFKAVLKAVATAWQDDRENVRKHAGDITQHLKKQHEVLGPALSVGVDELERAVDQYWESFDSRYGGFGAAPKFPPATGVSLLLRLHRRLGDPRALEMACRTLDAMALGGMYDHLAGGFARYSTDRRWLVPHFEKMLYDNALLANVYLEAYQATDRSLYRSVAQETLDYVMREMTAPDGGFYSSTDADSEGEEGKFFVWDLEEVEHVLGPDVARVFNAYYDVSPGGNWEGKNVLNVPRPAEQVAASLGLDVVDLNETLAKSRQKMYQARLARQAPATDDKILGAWNGLMISAFASGYRILGEAGYLSMATRAADFIAATLVQEDGNLLRTYRSGKAHLRGCLEDYAYLAEGLIDLFEVSGDVGYLRRAEGLLRKVVSEFTDPESGAFFSTPSGSDELLLRYRDGADGATPAPNAVAAGALARISYHLNEPGLRETAVRSIEAYGSTIARFPRGFAKSLVVVDFLEPGPIELTMIGKLDSEDMRRMRQEVARYYLPRKVEAVADLDHLDEDLPLLDGKTAVDGKPTLYVCRDYACQPPMTQLDEVGAALQRVVDR
jgi:uncharacterized protein YyaL (SSP411 family)